MMNRFNITILLFFCAALVGCGKNEQSLKKITPVDFSHVKITDRFWASRFHSHATTTLAACIDQIENKTGVYAKRLTLTAIPFSPTAGSHHRNNDTFAPTAGGHHRNNDTFSPMNLFKYQYIKKIQ